MYITNSMIHSFNDITKVFIEDNRNSKITSVTVYTDSNIKLKPIYEYNCMQDQQTADIYEDPKYKDASSTFSQLRSILKRWISIFSLSGISYITGTSV